MFAKNVKNIVKLELREVKNYWLTIGFCKCNLISVCKFWSHSVKIYNIFCEKILFFSSHQGSDFLFWLFYFQPHRFTKLISRKIWFTWKFFDFCTVDQLRWNISILRSKSYPWLRFYYQVWNTKVTSCQNNGNSFEKLQK